LLFHSLIQSLDLHFKLHVQCLQLTPPMSRVGCQRQRR
jgi:hypothetical protein